jgi:hypothetical protein
LLKGNNHQVIQKCLQTASRQHCWQKIPPNITLFDFKWSPVSSFIKFEFLGKHGEKNLVNHFEHHGCIT